MRSILIGALHIMASTFCSAQSSINWSIQAGLTYGRSWLVGKEAGPLDNSWRCDCDTTLYTGSYVSPFVGIDAKFLDIVHGGLQIGIQSISTSGIYFTDSLPSLDRDGNVIISLLQSSGTVELFDVTSRVYVGAEFPLQFTAELGLNVVINASSKRTGKLQIVSNDSVTFIDNFGGELSSDGRTINFDYGPISKLPAIRYDVDVAVGKAFTFDQFTIHLQALYRHGLSNLTPPERLFSRAIAGSLSLMYRL